MSQGQIYHAEVSITPHEGARDEGSDASAEQVRPTSPAGKRWWRRWSPAPEFWLGLSGVVSMVVAWYILVRLEAVSPRSIPPPADVLQRMVEFLTDGAFYAEVLDTMWTWFAAMLVTGVTGSLLGLLLGYFTAMYRPASTVIHAARSVPSTALIPVAILFFGLGFQMKFALVVYAIVWPVVLNTMYGVHNTDPQMITVSRSLRWSRSTILRRTILPSAAPYIATGLRVAGAIGLIVVISAELLGATSGIGTVIIGYQIQQRPQPDYVFAGIILVGLIGMLVYYAMIGLERRILPWASAHRRQE